MGVVLPIPSLLRILLLLAPPSSVYVSASPTQTPYLTVTFARIFGTYQQCHDLGHGYIPLSVEGRDLRISFSGESTGQGEEGVEFVKIRKGGGTENGKLVGVGGGGGGEADEETLFRWDMEGRISHKETRCLDLTEPESLIDAPQLGLVNLVQFWTCDGGTNQQWVALQNSRKIASVAHPGLCLSPLELGDEDVLGGVECGVAREIEILEFFSCFFRFCMHPYY
ncbi:hypothetical protein DFH27DRAFT_521738 [Peziza echinospora]|nr:hypothetical protein DFH27DRAFT_521738 [Peziza echinospora]